MKLNSTQQGLFLSISQRTGRSALSARIAVTSKQANVFQSMFTSMAVCTLVWCVCSANTWIVMVMLPASTYMQPLITNPCKYLLKGFLSCEWVAIIRQKAKSFGLLSLPFLPLSLPLLWRRNEGCYWRFHLYVSLPHLSDEHSLRPEEKYFHWSWQLPIVMDFYFFSFRPLQACVLVYLSVHISVCTRETGSERVRGGCMHNCLCLSICLNAVDPCVSQVSVIRIISKSHQGEPLISHLAWWGPTGGDHWGETRPAPLCLSYSLLVCLSVHD